MQRSRSLDLLKVIAMWFIMTAHFMGWGGAVNSLTTQDPNYFWVMPVYFLSQTGNTLFFLISGYFLSECKPEKALFLERKTVFYSVGGSLVMMIIQGGITISLVKSFFPLIFNNYWFISVYLVLYLFGGILRRGCESVTKPYYLIGMAAIMFGNLFINSPKYTVLEGLMAFLAGYYIHRFRPLHKLKQPLTAALFAGTFLLYSVWRVAALKLGIEHTALDEGARYFLIFFTSVFLFIFFEKTEFKKLDVSFFSKNVVAVYLITAHPQIRNGLYQTVLHIDPFCREGWFILYYVAVNSAIMVGCILIDKAVSIVNRRQTDFWYGLLRKLSVCLQRRRENGAD